MSSRAKRIQRISAKASTQLLHLNALAETNNRTATKARLAFACSMPLLALAILSWRSKPVLGITLSAGMRLGLRFGTMLLRQAL